MPTTRSAAVRIGCSGWQYKHWRGDSYPAELGQSRWFEFYAARFDTVEINNSFYRLPEAETFARWGEQAPRQFLYAVQVPRTDHGPSTDEAPGTKAQGLFLVASIRG